MGDAGVEAGVLDGDGHARGGEFEQALVLLSEVGGELGLQVDDADDAVLDDERDGELGENRRVGFDVVVDLFDVFDEDGAVLGGGLADDAAPGLDAHALDLWGVACLETDTEVAGAVVDEEDGEDAVVDDGADEVGDAMHEGVKVEGGVERVGEAEEEVELDGLVADVGGGGGIQELRLCGAVVAFEVIDCLYLFGSFGLGRGGHCQARFYACCAAEPAASHPSAERL